MKKSLFEEKMDCDKVDIGDIDGDDKRSWRLVREFNV